MKVILVDNMGQEETAIAIVGTKGQIVIPQKLRRELKIPRKLNLRFTGKTTNW
jgi:bifunctional DNA-binding transcriptional regulator/antitoxin component of YhaV-PrlF toxin-antitoxin module